MNRYLSTGRPRRPNSLVAASAIRCRSTAPRVSSRSRRQEDPQQGPEPRDPHAFTAHRAPMQDYVSPGGRLQIRLSQAAGENHKTWTRWLERYLPPEVRKDRSDATQRRSEIPEDQLARSRQMLDIFTHARNWNKDILNWLGFEVKRWPTVHAVLSSLLDSLDVVSKECVPSQPISNLDWGSAGGLSLDEVTSKVGRDVLRNTRHLRRETTHLSFRTLTDQPHADHFARMLLGQVFRSLGDIIIESANRPDEEAKVAMSYVFRILGRLHHSGYIPERIYTYTPTDSELTGIHRPPGMNMLSTHIFNILSDAAWVDHEPTVMEGKKSPFIPFKMATRELGLGIWLEFILWCCVEHGLVLEATSLLQRTTLPQAGGSWHFQSWKPFLQNPKLLFSTNVDSDTVFRRDGSLDEGGTVFHGLGKRTISSELVASIVHNQMNHMFAGLSWRGISPQYVLRDTGFFRKILAPHSGAAGFESPTRVVNSMVARFIESGGIDVLADPQTFGKFLGEQTRVVPPWVHGRFDTEEKAADLTKSQLYNESSAFTGLMEYNVDSFATQAQTGPALMAFGKLLNIIDTSKSRHLNKFFQQVGILESPSVLSLDADREASAIPQMSNVTFARLLDTARFSGEFAFAEWMLSSQDVDSPVIPRSAYGDQVLVPPLLRFAAATGDEELFNQVAGSLQAPLALNTLKSLLNVRITMAQWDSVVALLEFIRDNRSKSWGSSNIITFAVAILRLDHSINQPGQAAEERESKSRKLNRAKQILLRLLNGEFNQRTHLTDDRYQCLLIQTFCDIFTTIPGPLSELVDHVDPSYRTISSPDASHRATPTLPINSLNELLAAIVDLHGSAAGKRFWETWLVDHLVPSKSNLGHGNTPRLFANGKMSFNKGNPTYHGRWLDKGTKVAVPNLHTVRILARKAMEEGLFEDTSLSHHNSSDIITPLKVLNFAVRHYRRLGLPVAEINRETNNHFWWMQNAGLLGVRNRLGGRSTAGRPASIDRYDVGLRIGGLA